MKGKMLDSIGYRQVSIMRCAWEFEGSLTVTDIVDYIEKTTGKRLSNACVTNLCGSLVKKGYLEIGEKRGRSFTYLALITEDEFQEQEIQRLKKITFGGSFSQLVNALMRTDDVKPVDYEGIKRILKEHEK